ncbi:MAG: hypothetical protein IKP68_05300 [Clostridia bacterium]|nr:hypothetical protein [Clostridia bacterium]MBR7078691.1 hypothetical protein [Clostridia bacterium]
MDNEKLNELLVNVWDSLTDEQKAKAKACKTPDELLKLAAEEGIELPDELLDAAAGGALVKITDKYGYVTWNVYQKGIRSQIFEWNEFDKAKQFAEANHISTEIKTQEEAEAEKQC